MTKILGKEGLSQRGLPKKAIGRASSQKAASMKPALKEDALALSKSPAAEQPFAHPTFRSEPVFSKQQQSRLHIPTPVVSQQEPPPPSREPLSAELRYILGLFISTRMVLILIGLVSYAVLPLSEGKQVTWSRYSWLDMWGVWDSFWYMDIVQNGYSTASKLIELPDQTNFPFFPLYPLLVKGMGWALGVGGAFPGENRYFLAGIFISNVCLLLSCYVLYKLVEMQWNKNIARRSVQYLFLFPVSFILSGVFTESLYLLLSLLCFYLAKRRNWWMAGLCGGLLSATRTLGVLIAIPLLYEYLKSIDFSLRQVRFNSLFLILVPVGLAAFSLYTYRETGDPLFFKTNQTAWDREIMNPLASLWQALSQGLSEPSYKKLLECAFFITAFATLSLFYRAIGFSYWLFGMYSIVVPLSAGIASMPRFTLPVFPLFIALAILSRKGSWNRWLTLGLGGLQGALMVLWCTGYGLVI